MESSAWVGDVAMGLVAAVSSLYVTGVLYSRYRELDVGDGILYVLTRAVEWVQGNGNGRDEKEVIPLVYSLRLKHYPQGLGELVSCSLKPFKFCCLMIMQHNQWSV